MEFEVAVVKTAWVVMDSEVVIKVAWVVYKVAGVDYVAGVVSLENCSDTISQVVVCSDGWTVGRMGRIDLSIIQIFWPGPVPNDLSESLTLCFCLLIFFINMRRAESKCVCHHFS